MMRQLWDRVELFAFSNHSTPSPLQKIQLIQTKLKQSSLQTKVLIENNFLMFTKGNGRFPNFVNAEIGLLNPLTEH